MTSTPRRRWIAPASTLLVLGALAAAVPSTAFAAVDPSAYGVAADGPTRLAPAPAVDWSSGSGLSSSDSGAKAAGLSAGSGQVTAGNGYATAVEHEVHYGELTIVSAAATCQGGLTNSNATIQTSATADTISWAGGERTAAVGDLTIRTDVVTRYPDGSTSVAAAVITGPGGQQITIAAARCGAHS